MEKPSHTLYLRGLEEKVHPDRIKLMLYTAFSRYGTILDIVCSRRNKLRGQAWVVFKEVLQATEAKKAMQGVTMYGKEVKIEYAKAKSDVIARVDGSFKPRPKRKPEDGLAQGPKRPERESGNASDNDDDDDMDTSEQNNNPAAQASMGAPVEELAPPHKMLLIQNLPAEASKEALEILFNQYPGLREVRHIVSRNVAFVEFDTVEHATLAKEGSQGFKLDATHEINAVYAKQ